MSEIERDQETYSEHRRALEERYASCELVPPLKPSRYDAGDVLDYEVTGVIPARPGRVRLEVERFVGGGFAGQVYRVRLLEVESAQGPIAGLEPGKIYAIKILKPPSGFANFFRDNLYAVGFQHAFSPRVEPAAVRVGVLWQKLIRRAVALEMGRPDAVCDTYATFYDAGLHSHGEINEFVEGRIWKFEVDPELFERWRFTGNPPADQGAPEYVHKKLFMRGLVDLLHRMGAPELARQYEWWSLKSQPNALKRTSAEGSPGAGLTAIDFRAGLALLPFLPMSPIDVKLILRGLVRGRLVQFDRADLPRLRAYVESRREDFADLLPALDQLEIEERRYRGSMPDLTRQGLRLLVDGKLRRSVKRGKITSWRSLGRLDDVHAGRLEKSSMLFAFFLLAAIIPFVGAFLITVWGNSETRRHLARCFGSPRYLWRAMKGARVGPLIDWLRCGRVSGERARSLVDRPLAYWAQRLTVGWLPPSWHRFLTDWGWARDRFRQAVQSGLRFLREPSFREEVLRQQVRQGEREGMLTAEEASRIQDQVGDPYIQKYLRFLAVHMCTVPITQVTMVLVGAGVVAYCLSVRALSWPESMALGTAAAAAIQLLPVSPGSLTRGLFVLFLMIKERDVKNYYVAAPVSFLHVIGYLAFPLQMVTHNPALARFLAGRWTVSVVRLVPVFGEHGALIEHGVFDALFNAPISAMRSWRRRPLRWSFGALLLAAVLSLATLGAVARIWEWRQPPIELETARLEAAEPYRWSARQLHWSLDGTRARIEGVEGTVDFPAKRWNEALASGDRVRAVVRKSFFGEEYDGLEIHPVE